MKRAWLLLCVVGAAWAAEPPVLMDERQESRYQALTQELRCLVCQNQNIADSHAPLAQDLRQQVRDQIVAGRSDHEIKQYMTERYGDFVLYSPPFNPVTVLLWLGPALLIALGLAVALLRMRRHAPRAAARAVDAERLKKILDDAP